MEFDLEKFSLNVQTYAHYKKLPGAGELLKPQPIGALGPPSQKDDHRQAIAPRELHHRPTRPIVVRGG